MIGVIQVGAHWGEEYEGWVAEGATNFLFFEPVKANFDKLKSIFKTRQGNFRFENVALGNFAGITKMYIETSHGGKSCSVLEPLLHLKQYPDIVFNKREFVRINKLDYINYDRTLYDHLCIDVEGYEYDVLLGAVESLQHIKTIDCEVHRAELFKGSHMFLDVVKLLFEQGFSLSSVQWKGNTWGDAHFVKLPPV